MVFICYSLERKLRVLRHHKKTSEKLIRLLNIFCTFFFKINCLTIKIIAMKELKMNPVVIQDINFFFFVKK